MMCVNNHFYVLKIPEVCSAYNIDVYYNNKKVYNKYNLSKFSLGKLYLFCSYATLNIINGTSPHQKFFLTKKGTYL